MQLLDFQRSSAVPICERGAIHLHGGRDPQTQQHRVWVTAPGLPAEEARIRLGSLARAHRLLAGENVPGVADESLDGASPWVALDCDGVVDQEHLADFVRHSGDKPHLQQASVMGKTIMETLIRCHGVKDPQSRRPMCLGSLAPSNVLFTAEGRIWLIGFGAGPFSGACIAPDVAAGAPPTPGADVYALTVFIRSRMSLVRMPSILRRVFTGKSVVRDARLMLLYAWSNWRVLAGPAERRPNMEVALSKTREMWRIVGIEPDSAGFAAWVQSVLSATVQRAEGLRIVLGPDAEWLETPDGNRHRLSTHRPLRRLLLALAEARNERPGTALSVEQLLEAGWPGEHPIYEAGVNRVYVAISSLRKLGLGELLQRWDGGYRLAPSLSCHVEGSPARSTG
jgi:hypothetical protein